MNGKVYTKSETRRTAEPHMYELGIGTSWADDGTSWNAKKSQ